MRCASLDEKLCPSFWPSVTGPDGSFSIKDVPDGTYKAVAWQEKFNKRTLSQNVTVKGGKATLNFTFERPKKK